MAGSQSGGVDVDPVGRGFDPVDPAVGGLGLVALAPASGGDRIPGTFVDQVAVDPGVASGLLGIPGGDERIGLDTEGSQGEESGQEECFHGMVLEDSERLGLTAWESSVDE